MIAYDTSVDRVVAYVAPREHETWLFDIRTGTWSRSGAETPIIEGGVGAAAITYDEAAKRTVIIGVGRRPPTTRPRTAGRCWSHTSRDAGALPMVYDPVNERLVGLEPACHRGPGRGLFAFDLATREWIVLLEPGAGRRRRAPSELHLLIRECVPRGEVAMNAGMHGGRFLVGRPS